jgi:3-oxoacyl-[acyl-carrier protein] reductase
MSQTVILTGGQGSLAQVIAQYLAQEEPDWTLLTPSRAELDVSSEASISDFWKQHSCDLLIAAAGEVADAPLWKMTSSDWDRILHGNLRGAAFAAKCASRDMLKKRRGHIIFLSSYSAYHPPIGQVAYASAKAALLGLTRTLAKEWGPAQIRVNAILPGFLENRMTAHVTDSRKSEVLAQHCLRQFNTQHAVAAFIHTLHARMPYTSGQVFNLDSRVISD